MADKRSRASSSSTEYNGELPKRRATRSKRTSEPESVKVEQMTPLPPPSHLQQLLGDGPPPVLYSHVGAVAQHAAEDDVKLSQTSDVDVKEEEDDDDALSMEAFYGSLQTSVVGIRYYNGIVGKFEHVQLIRDANNLYDENAVAVWNVRNVQVGHIPREVAAVFARLLDGKMARLEGVCPVARDPSKTSAAQYKIPLEVAVFGSEENRQMVTELLKRCGLFLDASKEEEVKLKGKGNEGERMRDLLNGNAGSLRTSKDLMDEIATPMVDLSKLPQHERPPNDSLVTQLLPYQLQGLAWCAEREQPVLPSNSKQPAVQFWKCVGAHSPPQYQHVVTNFITNQAPPLVRGGILADDMGLGKTLTMIALMLLEHPEPPVSLPPAQTYEKGTLVVAPLSVIGNWASQIDNHVKPGHLTYYIYHGASRVVDIAHLRQFDVVITSYQIVANEFVFTKKLVNGQPKGKPVVSHAKGPLASIRWRRVILDEGHIIKNKAAKQSLACSALEAERRWLVSGTPITNHLDDLFSVVRFLRLEPFNDPVWWKRAFAGPIRRGERVGVDRLRALMQFLCIRRTKAMTLNGKPILQLPACTIYIHKIELGAEERAMYDKVFTIAQQRILDYMESEAEDKNYAHILEIMMRLRQICNHVSLCPRHFAENLERTGGGAMIADLLVILREAEDSGEDCPICLDQLHDSVITPCRHFFCEPCITETLSNDARCPMCRGDLKKRDLIRLPPPASDVPEGQDAALAPTAKVSDEAMESAFKPNFLSSKVKALVDFLVATPKGIKSLVYSQWTSMLDIIELHLRDKRIRFVRFDGTMSRGQRDATLAQFKTSGEDDDVNVLLISLKCGSVGLNITEASQVFLVDPWWNSAIESQAIDRVYRLGQKRPVNVFRFVTTNTVEDRVLEIQHKKQELIRQAFSGIRGASDRNAKEERLRDIRLIFGLEEKRPQE
ncbi:hypothetical protein RI367_001551 [Sorochytrium milnesiophthora]